MTERGHGLASTEAGRKALLEALEAMGALGEALGDRRQRWVLVYDDQADGWVAMTEDDALATFDDFHARCDAGTIVIKERA